MNKISKKDFNFICTLLTSYNSRLYYELSYRMNYITKEEESSRIDKIEKTPQIEIMNAMFVVSENIRNMTKDLLNDIKNYGINNGKNITIIDTFFESYFISEMEIIHDNIVSFNYKWFDTFSTWWKNALVDTKFERTTSPQCFSAQQVQEGFPRAIQLNEDFLTLHGENDTIFASMNKFCEEYEVKKALKEHNIVITLF